MSDGAKKTPLIELLRSVPKDFRGEWECQWWDDGTPSGHAMAPVGRYCHEAADELERKKDFRIHVKAWNQAQQEIERLEARLSRRSDALKLAAKELAEDEERIAELEAVADAAKALTLQSWNDMPAVDDALEVLIEKLAALEDSDDTG